MNYILKYVEVLQKLYPDRTFVWQKDKTGYFERILENQNTIMEFEFEYFPYYNGETPKINPKTGTIALYFQNDLYKNHYNFMGLEIDDPYANSNYNFMGLEIDDHCANSTKERRKLNFSLTGSEWAIQDYLPHIFDNDYEVIEKIKAVTKKKNELLGDFKNV